MNRKWLLGVVGLTGTMGNQALGQFGERHTVKSKPICYLPIHDYKSMGNLPIGEQRALSGIGLPLLPPVSDPNPKEKPIAGKLFQMDREKLVINHCQVSKVALTLSESGDWSFSFDANQNKVLLGDKILIVQRPSLKPKQTSQLLRNEFHVKARGLGLPPSGLGPNSTLGNPSLWEIDLGKFQVENGEPGSRLHQGHNASLGKLVQATQQVEYFFTYE